MNPEITILYQFHYQKALFKGPKTCNINFWIENDPPLPLELFRKFICFGGGRHPLQLKLCCNSRHSFHIQQYLPGARFDEARIHSILIHREGLELKESRMEILPVDQKGSFSVNEDRMWNALWILLNGTVVVLLTF